MNSNPNEKTGLEKPIKESKLEIERKFTIKKIPENIKIFLRNDWASRQERSG